MKNAVKNIFAVLGIVIVLMLSPMMLSFNDTSAANDDKVLFDMGNGTTKWVDLVFDSGDSIDAVLEKTANSIGMNYDSSGDIIIDGLTKKTIGASSTSGSLTNPGTTGITVTSEWIPYSWNETTEKWEKTILSATYTSGFLAIGFHPDDGVTVPVETPIHMTSWTMIRGNSEQSGEQEYTPDSTKDASVKWTGYRGGTAGVYASPLYAGGQLFVKYGVGSTSIDSAVISYDADGNILWEFEYEGLASYENVTPLIVGDYIYVQSEMGQIYKFPWEVGPHTPGTKDEANVTKLVTPIPDTTITPTDGMRFGSGTGSMVYASGSIFVNGCNGMVYCFDLNLNLVWSYQMQGYAYFSAPTVIDDYVFSGAFNGHLHALSITDGSEKSNVEIYTLESKGRKYGGVSSPTVFKDGSSYTLIFSFSDGRGMSAMHGGIGIYSFDGTSLTKKQQFLDTFGLMANYLQVVNNSDFKGVYFTSANGLYSMTTSGTYKLLNSNIPDVRAGPTLVNGTSLILATYEPRQPIYEVDLNGKILSTYAPSTTVRQYGMSSVVIFEGLLIAGNDAGLVVISGTMPEYIPPADDSKPWWYFLVVLAIIIAIILAVIYCVLRFVKGIEKPFSYIRGRMAHYMGGSDLKHNTKSKHRLFVVFMIGIILTIAIFIASLCIGPTIMSVPDMFGHLFSAIGKGGQGLTYDELMVYESRLPRALAAMAVGIGLSIAGCMYQAIIRNPLVDPYIMGVSAGAGTAAIAVIAFEFTFFGLFAPHSIYLTAFAAIFGGVLAFFATMFIAEKAGGSSLNYVLAGVVIGLAFGAVQTLMMSMAGHQVNNALTWLFGSFANVAWNQVWIIVVPAIALAIVPLIWAKEFNLVLLGDDQAQQMGLDVRKFDRTMLILASILTAICVAFVGIIGFVGLVVPHLCRMMLGGDHRLVLPASIAFGGALMLVADLAARTLYFGQELPVGAITTIIGVPVFAYLLIKRGKLYDG